MTGRWNNAAREEGMVLFIVMGMMIGLVAVVLAFSESMRMEYRASVNSSENAEAAQVVNGVGRYLTYVLSNSTTPGTMPLPDSESAHAATPVTTASTGDTFKAEEVSVGSAYYWVIGRADGTLQEATIPAFGLVDEASKLNLNTATLEMLQMLPNMTPELAQSIIDWRSDPSNAQMDVYATLKPPYQCKHAPFETVEELRLVYGATWDLLYGSDTNLNGILDPDEREKQGTGTPVRGLLDCVTVYSKQSNQQPNGQRRIDVRVPIQTNSRLSSLLQRTCGDARASEIENELRDGPVLTSVLQFYIVGKVATQEAAQMEDSLTADSGQFAAGKVNVNTALREVLICLPGIGDKYADALIATRQGKAQSDLKTVAWVSEILDNASAVEAGPYITARSYQYSADVVGVGSGGHAFNRSLMVFDTSGATPAIKYVCDHTYLGWPLGVEIRETLDGKTPSLGKTLS